MDAGYELGINENFVREISTHSQLPKNNQSVAEVGQT